ncbi:hypothetical protein [Streptomyces sp. CL12-4]|jgi:hypothetical protein|uniref:hypothetical protein n=1 Tax=Streptomyces sp. CL12-4 TaxID=2810306 RepID=UPI001EFC14E8|nr:hypothetical protein [Streptomyces sp. CL12-4]MCG8971402.1 hypothetical protein [Streptomyces sp. CL12-4]
MTDAHPVDEAHGAFERAAASLSSPAGHVQAEAVRTLVRIVREDPGHRQQALTALDGFVQSQRGGPGYRAEPVQDARTALYAFDSRRSVRTLVAVEGAAAVLLATPVVTGDLFGGGATRVLACVGVTAVLLMALSFTTRFWKPFLGPWALLMATASDRRVPGAYIAVRVILLALLLDLLVQAVTDSSSTAALYGVALCAVVWGFYGRRPRAMRLW